MKQLNYGLCLLVWASMLSGCLVGPDYKRPAMPSPAAYSRTNAAINPNDSIVNLKWFNLFGDPVLNTLLDSVLKRNYDLKAAVARIDQAQAQYSVAGAQLFPAIGYNGGAVQNFGSTTKANTYSIGTGISWEADIWGKIRRAKRAALDDMLATKEAKKAVQSTLVATAATAYFQLRDFDNRLSIAKSTMQTRQESYNLQQQKFQKGYIAEWDVLQAKQLLDDATATVAFYERASAVVEHYLSTLMAQPPGAVKRGLENNAEPQPPVIPSGLPSSLLENRPDVKQAEYIYMRETERIGVYQALRYPSISLTGLFGFASTDLSGLFKNSAGSITESILGPIFAAGANKRRVEAQRKSAEIAGYQYCSINLKALKEVEDALVSVETLTRELTARNSRVESARKVVLLSQARYDNGFSSYLELLDAQRTLFEAELVASAVRQQQLSAYVELYRSLGGGW